MWIGVGVFGIGGVGIRSSNMPILVLAGLGIGIAVYYSVKRVKYDNLNASSEGDSEISATEDKVCGDTNGGNINQLPDDILCNIVSRLEVIQASRTSILSRTWRQIWTKNPIINFRCLKTFSHKRIKGAHDDHHDRLGFFRAVDQCLKLYSGQKLLGIRLQCCFLGDCTSRLVQWMQTISKLEVEELHLVSACQFPRSPSSWFTFSFRHIYGISTLRELNLEDCYIEPVFPSQHKSLVTLRLIRIQLLRDEILRILESCPNLLYLSLRGCTLPFILSISGPNLKLEALELIHCHGLRELDISAVNLVTVKIESWDKIELVLSFVPKLENLIVRMSGTPYCFGGFPRELPRLKYLLINTALQKEMDEIPRLPPSFKMFGCIKILFLLVQRSWLPWSTKYDRQSKVDLWNITPVMGACPLLQKLGLVVEGPFRRGEKRDQWPVLRHKHLEVVELSGFSQTTNEFEFARFILRSAEVLRLLVLKTSFRTYELHRFRFYEREYSHSEIYEEESKAICESLQGHAISLHARVKIE